jgi:hypothetical protein
MQVGADAAIVVFDPATIIDRATYENPRAPSTDMRHVIVGGVAVIRDAALVRKAFPASRFGDRTVDRSLATGGLGFAPHPCCRKLHGLDPRWTAVRLLRANRVRTANVSRGSATGLP